MSCTLEFQYKFSVSPTLWTGVPKSSLHRNSGAVTDRKQLGTGEELDFLILSGQKEKNLWLNFAEIFVVIKTAF